MNEQEQRRCAEELMRARRRCVPIDPLISTHPDASVEDASAIQMMQVACRVAEGQAIVGHKVGLSSPAMQAQTGAVGPDVGHLLTDMFHPENYPISIDRYISPRIQPEVAFVLGRQLAGPGVTAAQAIRAVDFVVPAFEIVDSRFKPWDLTIVDTIADNSAAGGVILGGKPSLLREVELDRSAVELSLNGDPAASGLGGAVLGSPLNALVWLANTLGKHGTVLEEGHVVLPGSPTKASCLLPGDVVEATFSGMGSVRCRVATSMPAEHRRHVDAKLSLVISAEE